MSKTEQQQTTPRRGHHASLDYHRMLMDDPVRMDLYERAIRERIKPGDVVLDVGCGAGILSLLAARRGARVHGVEIVDIAGVARQIAQHNGFGQQITIHQTDMVTMEPLEPVDLVLGEFMGRFLIDDKMLDAVKAATKWLKPDGQFCPSRITLKLAPVGDIKFWSISQFQAPIFGLDYSPALTYALNYCYRSQLEPSALLSDPGVFHDWHLPSEPEPFDRTLTFEVERRGKLQGLAGWFEATLSPSIVLSTEPGIETHWGQYLFPLPDLFVEEGDTITVHLSLDDTPEDPIWNWKGNVKRGDLELGTFALESEQRLGER